MPLEFRGDFRLQRIERLWGSVTRTLIRACFPLRCRLYWLGGVYVIDVPLSGSLQQSG